MPEKGHVERRSLAVGSKRICAGVNNNGNSGSMSREGKIKSSVNGGEKRRQRQKRTDNKRMKNGVLKNRGGLRRENGKRSSANKWMSIESRTITGGRWKISDVGKKVGLRMMIAGGKEKSSAGKKRKKGGRRSSRREQRTTSASSSRSRTRRGWHKSRSKRSVDALLRNTKRREGRSNKKGKKNRRD